MKIRLSAKKSFVLIIVLFFLGISIIACGEKGFVQGEIQPSSQYYAEQILEQEKELLKGKSDSNSLDYNYTLFRINQFRLRDSAYALTDSLFFSALSNEFILDVSDREEYLETAISQYVVLLDNYSNEEGSLYQRLGVTYFKYGEYDTADFYLKLALIRENEHSEIYYYKSLIAAYVDGDSESAMDYLDKVDPTEMFITTQDYLAYKAELYRDLGNIRKAIKTYEKAIEEAPARFYLNYDISKFLSDAGEEDMAEDYIINSFEYLSSLDDPDYVMKGYLQRVNYNERNRVPTYRHAFDLDGGFDIYKDLYFYTGHVSVKKRKLSLGVLMPLKEVKESTHDKVYYTCFEAYADWPDNSGVFLTVGRASVSNGVWEIKDDLYLPKTKLVFQTNYMVLMTATNTLFYEYTPETNFVFGEMIITQNVEITTNNQIDLQPLAYDYHYRTDQFDVDGDNWYDFIAMGYNKSNEMMLYIYYPATATLESNTFYIENHDAELVIQDVDQDGTREIFLFDGELKIIKE